MIGQTTVPVLPHDTTETLSARVQAAEKALLNNVIASFPL